MLSPRLHSCVTLAGLIGFGSLAASGNPVLIQAPPTLPASISVQTWRGPVEAKFNPITPSRDKLVLIFLDGLDPDQLQEITQDLTAMYASNRVGSFRIATSRAGQLAIAGPFASRLKLAAALRELQPAPLRDTAPVDSLAANASQLGQDWSSVFVAGNLGGSDPVNAEYGAAVVAKAFETSRLRLFAVTRDTAPVLWEKAAAATGGGVAVRLRDAAALLGGDTGQYLELQWDGGTLTRGFLIYQAKVADGEIPEIVSSGSPLPSLAKWVEMRKSVAAAIQAGAEANLDKTALDSIHAALSHALEIDPRDELALRTAAAHYARFSDFATAATLYLHLAEVRPLDGAVLISLGKCELGNKQTKEAERDLLRARELGVAAPAGSEELARIHIRREDEKGSLVFLAEALDAYPKRQDLWFLQADAALRSKSRELAVRSYERGLALGGANLKERSALIAIQIENGAPEKALEQVRAAVSSLPGDAPTRALFADYLEQLKQPDEALALWRKSLESDGAFEPGHYHVAKLLLARNDAAGAFAATTTGMEAGAISTRLYMVRADAMAALGDVYRRRAILQEGAHRFSDPEILLALAETEDQFSTGAAASWSDLVESMDKARAKPDEIGPVLRRGLLASLRDQDTKRTDWFTHELTTRGDGAFSSALTRPNHDRQEYLVIPGGMDALAFMARGKEKIAPDRFLAEYCRIVADFGLRGGAPEVKKELAEFENYFQTLSALQNLGHLTGDTLVLNLSLADKQARRETEKVMSLLAIKLHSSKGEVTVEQNGGGSKARQHDIVSALAIDEVGIADALGHGKSYKVEIPFDKVPVYPNEQLWRESFYPKANLYGGFVEAAIRTPKMAELYFALSSLDKPTVQALMQAVPLNLMAEKHADSLMRDSAAFSVRNGKAMVPGGVRAETAWASLVGVSPSDAASFFRTLIEKDNGHLLAFYNINSDLDLEHASFFALNPARLSQFYKLFQQTEEGRSAARLSRNTSFSEFLENIPLDADGHVAFPGSPNVWMVASGASRDEAHTNKMLQRVSRSAAPDEENSVLIRMVQTRYEDHGKHSMETENFRAVVQIDQHRPEPLDEASALLLAQNYTAYGALYPYFTNLVGLKADDYRIVFSLMSKMDGQHSVDTNIVLGQIHALLALVALFERRNEVTPETGARLVREMCSRFQTANSPAEYSRTSADTVFAMTSALKGDPEKSVDETLRRALLGKRPIGPNAAYDHRRTDFERVLEMQRAPRLETLFRIQAAAAALAGGQSAGPEIDRLEQEIAKLPAIEITKAMKAKGREKELIERYEPAAAEKVVAEMRKAAAKKKGSAGEFTKLSNDVLAELNPQYTLALSGLVYAWYLRSQDLVVGNDALLLRKHRYFDYDAPARQPISPFRIPAQVSSEGLGAYFIGGFAQFATASGHAASAGMKAGKGVNQEQIAAQLDAVRDTSWDLLRQEDVRLASLRIQVAREWMVAAATNPAVYDALARNTLGLLSAPRRTDLLNGIDERRWNRVWSSVTLADLYQLGARYNAEFRQDAWSSPTVAGLRAAGKQKTLSHIDLLGPVAGSLSGCSHPHLQSKPPYEHYETHMMPIDMAERTAEFKLYLAYTADGMGLNPPSLGQIAEPLATDLMQRAQMTDPNDWRSLIMTLAELDAKAVRSAFEKSK